jgi:protein ImuB
MFACIHGPLPNLSAIAGAFTPSYELTAPGTIVFRVDGLTRLYGTLQHIADAIAHHTGGNANIAIAETADAAVLAARSFPGVTVEPDLQHLPVSSLPLTPEMEETLESWGIHTLAQFAQLPEIGIAERFGSTGVYWQRLARGAIDRPLKIFQPETTYEDRIELDHPASLLEPLLFLIARILNDQCARMLSNAMAANEVTIRLELEDKSEHLRTLHLPVPMRESKSLLKLLQMDLEAHPPQAATMALSLILKPVHPRTVQNGIFLPITPAPDKLELTLARIRGIVGEQNVGIPELLDTHHPHPFRMTTNRQPFLSDQQPPTIHQSMRYYRPPISAKVDVIDTRPVRITAPGIFGKVVNAAGPWRTSGDWWTATKWNRDEWDITLSNTTMYRIYQEQTSWFLDATYD